MFDGSVFKHEMELFQKIATKTQPVFPCSKSRMETPEQLCEICSKLTTKTPERRHSLCSDLLCVDFKQILHIVLVFPLLTLNK